MIWVIDEIEETVLDNEGETSFCKLPGLTNPET